MTGRAVKHVILPGALEYPGIDNQRLLLYSSCIDCIMFIIDLYHVHNRWVLVRFMGDTTIHNADVNRLARPHSEASTCPPAGSDPGGYQFVSIFVGFKSR